MGSSKFFIAYLLISFVSLVNAQSFYKVIGTGGHDYAEQVINDRDSGYVIVGGTEGLGQGEMDGYMVKLDTAGNIQWTRTFGSAGVDYLTGIVLLDDGFLCSGYTNDQGDYQIFVIRTNELGQVVWEKDFGNDNWEFPEAMTLINDTTAMIVGAVFGEGETTKDALVFSVTVDGDSVGYNVIGGDYNDVLERIILSDSGQIYSCGSYEVEQDNSDYWINRLNADGSFMWELFLGDTLNDYAHGITELITGEFIVTGGDAGITGTNIDNIFYKIDSLGNVLYQNVLNNPNDDIGMDVLSYPDTNKFILINSSSSVGFGGFDTWLFDCNYYTYGVEDFSFVFGSSHDDQVVDADTTFDKGVICVGNMQDDVLGNVIFVHKTNSEQNALLTYQTEEDMMVGAIGGDEVKFYPNPTIGTVNFLGSDFNGCDYQIFDLQGKHMGSGKIISNRIELDLLKGIYFLQIGEITFKLVVADH
ncbi:MAG: T9SS type A sorting domain-containing protein [Flavobacteriales bacterium]|nr:T9SS type A sorting domain-containing protein [Flavobacteriales bacterium]